MIYFTSDLHFCHRNIIKYNPKYRPFKDVEEMNAALIEYWNATVKPEDTVYHLGDFCFGSATRTQAIKDCLNGNIVWIKGNHDKEGELYREIKIDGERLILFHFPIGSWHQQGRGSWHLHGHSHGSYKDTKGKMLDVGWDAHGKFLTFEDVRDHMNKQPIYTGDHH